MLRGLRGILYKEMIQVLRDPATVIISVLFPLFQLTLYGYAINTEVSHIPTAVLDLDLTPASRDFVHRMEATGLYDTVAYARSQDGLYQLIVSDVATVGVHIPPGYQRSIDAREQAFVQVLIDGSNNTTANQTLNTVQNIGFNISAELMGVNPMDGKLLPVDVRPRLLFNPNLRSAVFFVPGLVGILLFMVTMQLTAFAIVREREVGTLEQLMVTPISKSALMLGKVLPYMGLGMLQMLTILLFAQIVFDIHIEGNLYLLIALAFEFIFSSLGLGLIISTIARTQLQAMMMSFLVIMPSILLSGYIFPLESMPAPIKPLSALLPVTYFIEILRSIVIRGAGWESVWDEAAVLGAMGLGLLAFATLRLRKSLA